MKILITGGAGYKGLKLAHALLKQGYEVTILDNFIYGQEVALFLFDYEKVNFLKKDIRNISAKDVSIHDCIYHLAGISGYPACEANPHSAQTINVGASQRLFSMLSEHQLLIYASTTSIYGKANTICTEVSPVKPISLYSWTKYEAEKYCMERKNSIALRFATIFGVAPRMRWDLLVNDFTMKAVQERSLVLFDSASVRTFLHIDDAIQGYLLALESYDDMKGHIFNVGLEDLNYSKKQIALKIKEQIDFEIVDSTMEDPDARNFQINFEKIKKHGFIPQKTLEEGIRELIKLFRFYEPNKPFRMI